MDNVKYDGISDSVYVSGAMYVHSDECKHTIAALRAQLAESQAECKRLRLGFEESQAIIKDRDTEIAVAWEEANAAGGTSECERLRSDGKNVSRMIVMMAAEIAQARREPRRTGPKVGMGAAPVSTDIIVEFHKRAEDALAAGEE